MRVAFVTANYLPHTGGVQQHVASLASTLTSHGHQVTVYNLEPRGSRTEAGIPVVGLGRHAAVGDIAAVPSPSGARGLPQLLRDSGSQLVSVHTRFFPATWTGIAAGHRANIPVVLTEHGGGPVSVASPVIRAATRVVDSSAGRWAWRSADILLAVSQRSADFVTEECGRRPIVCGNGLDLAWWSNGPDVPSEARLVFVGRVVGEKGWRATIALVEQLGPGVALDLLGDGPDIHRLREVVVTKGLTDRVQVLGRCSPEEVRRRLRGAVLVNPSTAAEGLQTTLLEAAAAGARIVTYDVGGAAEVRKAGAAAWIVPVGAYQGLLPAVREALASRWVPAPGLDTYSWPAVTARYETAFEEAIRLHASA